MQSHFPGGICGVTALICRVHGASLHRGRVTSRHDGRCPGQAGSPGSRMTLITARALSPPARAAPYASCRDVSRLNNIAQPRAAIRGPSCTGWGCQKAARPGCLAIVYRTALSGRTSQLYRGARCQTTEDLPAAANFTPRSVILIAFSPVIIMSPFPVWY